MPKLVYKRDGNYYIVPRNPTNYKENQMIGSVYIFEIGRHQKNPQHISTFRIDPNSHDNDVFFRRRYRNVPQGQRDWYQKIPEISFFGKGVDFYLHNKYVNIDNFANQRAGPREYISIVMENYNTLEHIMGL
jgi:hypothetical protein